MPLDLIFVTPGNYTIEDDGVPGNNTSVIKDANGVVIFTFVHPADSLSFTVSTPGVNLTINITDSLGAADFRIGDLADAAKSPDSIVMKTVQTTGDVTLAAVGTITEGGSDLAPDIVAGTVILSAGTGIGTAANALETQTAKIEAETNTGGMNIGNFGAVQIGGLTDLVDGLNVETSGNLTFVNQGTIFLSEVDLDTGNPPTPLESVHGGSTSGNVSLTASGFNSDIIANTDIDAITVPHGNLTLTAGRDIALGTVGANFDNDVRASGSTTINAGRDFLIDGFSDLTSDDFGLATGGNLVINAGRNIHLRNVTGSDASILANGNSGADVILTTGFNGALIVDAPSGVGIDPLESNSGDVIINADRILLAATTSIRADNGRVVILPSTDGREIVLGSAGDAALAVELSDSELDRIFTPNLTIGDGDTGQISVTAAVSIANAPNVIMRSGTDISIGAALSVTGQLALRAGDNLFNLPGMTITANTFSAVVDEAGDDGNTGGNGALLGAVTATSISLVGGADADTLRGAEDTEQAVFGLGGNDIIVSSGEGHYFGGEGDDRMFAGNSSGLVPEVLDGGGGIDTLDTTSFGGTYVINLATGATNFAFESFINFENLVSGNGADTVTGTAANNLITTNGGNDSLTGAGGADTLAGGLGDDFYFVDLADTVIELTGEGSDRIFAGVSYILAAGLSVEKLTTDNNTGTGAINLTGNELVQQIFGNDGANILDGKGGADTLLGLKGNDSFIVDNAGDQIVELTGEGTDQVFASVSWTLGAGQSVEQINTNSTVGLNAINLTGNELANQIFGNNGNNSLDGKGGADFMVGRLGGDFYFVDNAFDQVIELAGEGNDRVFASVSYTLAAGQSVEKFTTASNIGTDPINLTGNELINDIFGNDGANILDGKGGSDILTGFAGADGFAFTTALGAGNIDQVSGFQAGIDDILLENAIFTGLAPGALPANAFSIGSATTATQRIVYNATTGALFFDADGNGAGVAVHFATLTGAPAISAADFTVI